MAITRSSSEVQPPAGVASRRPSSGVGVKCGHHTHCGVVIMAGGGVNEGSDCSALKRRRTKLTSFLRKMQKRKGEDGGGGDPAAVTSSPSLSRGAGDGGSNYGGGGMERSETRETAVTPSQDTVVSSVPAPLPRGDDGEDGSTKLVRLACPNLDDVRLARLPSCDVTSILKPSTNNVPSAPAGSTYNQSDDVQVVLCEQNEQLHYL